MKVTEITVTYGGKLNLGDYNSAHVEATATATLDEGDDHRECLRRMFADVRFEARTQAAELLEKRKARIDAVFASLPETVQQSIKE